MNAHEYAAAHGDAAVAALREFLAIPSISTLPEHASDMQRAAEWLAERMGAIGLEHVEIFPTPGHPIVYGDWLHAGTDAPTVLIYGHYDVQPVDPIALWETPPFAPTLRGDHLYARGAADDKGQVWVHIVAAEALLRTAGRLPVNVKFLIEGEEESGSVNLDDFIEAHQELLAADVALVSDSHILAPDLPAIVYGLRGLAYLEVKVSGPDHDLHSGTYGGAVHNPIKVLCEMIASLHDANGTVTVPGFYDRVRALDSEERASMARIPFTEEGWKRETGVPQPWGEQEYSIIERTSARPTLEPNGIWGGFTGEGAKTVIPAEASAKLSMRLVADQDPQEIADMVEAHLKRIAPPTVRVTVKQMHHGAGAIVPRDIPAMRAARVAYQAGFGNEPVFMREGGSIPVVATFLKVLRIPTVLMGFGLPDDNLHAPNERFFLPNFHRGIQTSIHFLNELAKDER